MFELFEVMVYVAIGWMFLCSVNSYDLVVIIFLLIFYEVVLYLWTAFIRDDYPLELN